MADSVTAAIGAIVAIGYLYLIAAKLAELPLWICIIAGIALMLWAFWVDAWRPWLARDSR